MRVPIPLVTIAALGFFSCGGDGTPSPTSTPEAAAPTATQAPEPTAAPTDAPTAAPRVTWHRDVQPLIERSCLRCHTDDGVGPRDFSRYEDAAPLAGVMAAYTDAGLMPPAAADPGCLDYDGSERMFLSEEERQVFTDWAELGAPQGDVRDAPEPNRFEDRITDPDLTVLPPRGYRPNFDASGNEYYCVILDPQQDDTFYINGFDVAVDRSDIVHHLVLYLDVDGDAGPEGAQHGDGFNCFHESGNTQMLHAWAPGGGPLIFEEGMGMKVEPHQRFVLQMHYYRSFDGADLVEDASGYRLLTSKSVDREIYNLPYGPTGFTIPAGVKEHTETASYLMNGELPNMKIWGTFPHMHLLGTRYKYWIDKKNGDTQCLLDSPRWDFHNQLTYSFHDPINLRQGDEIHFSCTWDNSASNPNQLTNPPVDVVYGDGTNDEMCFVFTYVSFSL